LAKISSSVGAAAGAGAGGGGGGGDGGAEALGIGDVVVGGQHQHHRVGVLCGDPLRREPDRRGGVAAFRLDEQPSRRQA